MNEQPQEAAAEDWSIKALWIKYEEIAMHFNDLLIKLRTQALGAVAAITTVIGIFAKSGFENRASWEVAAVVFGFLCIFWIAVWIIDFCYYNRLLIGAVAAIVNLEALSQNQTRVRHIDISTKIESAVSRQLSIAANCRTKFWLGFGRWAFYVIVFVALATACAVSSYKLFQFPSS